MKERLKCSLPTSCMMCESHHIPRGHPVHVSHSYHSVHPLMDYVLLIKHDFVQVVAFGRAKDKKILKVVSNNEKNKKIGVKLLILGTRRNPRGPTMHGDLGALRVRLYKGN